MKDKRWQAAIKVKGKSTHLGHFKNDVDAALKYDEAAILLGRKLNFPELSAGAAEARRAQLKATQPLLREPAEAVVPSCGPEVLLPRKTKSSDAFQRKGPARKCREEAMFYDDGDSDDDSDFASSSGDETDGAPRKMMNAKTRQRQVARDSEIFESDNPYAKNYASTISSRRRAAAWTPPRKARGSITQPRGPATTPLHDDGGVGDGKRGHNATSSGGKNKINGEQHLMSPISTICSETGRVRISSEKTMAIIAWAEAGNDRAIIFPNFSDSPRALTDATSVAALAASDQEEPNSPPGQTVAASLSASAPFAPVEDGSNTAPCGVDPMDEIFMHALASAFDEDGLSPLP